jgi:lambda family phage portal protein
MIGWLRNLLGKPVPEKRKTSRAVRAMEAIRARYENAQTTQENQPLWQLTDYLSAKAANSFQVRRTLKIRSRYEAANNSYYRGMIDSYVADLVGTGPRIQFRTDSRNTNRILENRWHGWATASRFDGKLRTIAKGKVGDGEGIALATTNKRLDDGVKLDWNEIESDQMTTPSPGFVDYFWVDGVVLDRLGNPTGYHILRHHPGDLFSPQLNPMEFDTWAPDKVIHWFRRDRPGQVRGIPEATPALELFATLRRYTKAVVAAAELAADFSAVLKTEAPADENAEDPEPYTTTAIDRGVMTTLPYGFDLQQFEPEQPTTTYDMFVRVILREIARCMQIPLNIAMGDSSLMNYSSGRLDHLGYHRHQRVVRSECESEALRKAVVAWYAEGLRVPGYFPRGLPEQVPPHRWFWDSAESIDPEKDANAEQLQLDGHTTTLAEIYAQQGKDWEEEIRQRGREVELMQELGLPVETARKVLDTSTRNGQGQTAEDTAASFAAQPGRQIPLPADRSRRGRS